MSNDHVIDEVSILPAMLKPTLMAIVLLILLWWLLNLLTGVPIQIGNGSVADFLGSEGRVDMFASAMALSTFALLSAFTVSAKSTNAPVTVWPFVAGFIFYLRFSNSSLESAIAEWNAIVLFLALLVSDMLLAFYARRRKRPQ